MKKSYRFKMSILSALLVSFLVITGCGGSDVAAPPLKVFVTSTAHDGNLGGLSGGDAICQARATAGGLPGTYKAWLSTNTTDAYCHVQGYTGTIATKCGQTTLPIAAGPWVRTDGYPFADTIDKLVNNDQVYTPVRYDENGTLVTGYYFTGTFADGTNASTQNCNGWTSALPADGAKEGFSAGAANWWTAGSGTDCDATDRLICFQTGAGGPLPSVTPPALSKKVFVTSTTYTGNLGGLTGADTLCQTRASAGGVANPTKFKAWLSNSTTDAKDHITSAGPWYRLDGVKVADSKADLIDGTLFTAITVDETGHYYRAVGDRAWSGTDGTGIKTANNCFNWTDGTTGYDGDVGIVYMADGWWTQFIAVRACNLTAALYCFEVD